MPLKPRTVIFVFCDERTRWPSYLTPKKYSHVYMLMQGKHVWHIVEPKDNYIQIKDTKVRSDVDVWRKIVPSIKCTIAVECEVIEPPTQKKWYVPMLIPASCHNFCRLISGVDVGWTFNPHTFLKKLLKLDKHRNYIITRMRGNEK